MVSVRPGIGYWTWTNPGGGPPPPTPTPVVDDGGGILPRRMTMAEIDAYFGRRRLTPAELAILMVIVADD